MHLAVGRADFMHLKVILAERSGVTVQVVPADVCDNPTLRCVEVSDLPPRTDKTPINLR